LAAALTAGAAALIAALFLVPPPLVFSVTGFALVLAAANFRADRLGVASEVGNRLVFWDVAVR